MNLVDNFYQSFQLFAYSDMLAGFKLSEQIFDNPGVDLVVGGGSTYSQNVLDDIYEIII